MSTGCHVVLQPPALGMPLVDMSIFNREQYGSPRNDSLITYDLVSLEENHEAFHIHAQNDGAKKKRRSSGSACTYPGASKKRRRLFRSEEEQFVQVPPDYDYWYSSGLSFDCSALGGHLEWFSECGRASCTVQRTVDLRGCTAGSTGDPASSKLLCNVSIGRLYNSKDSDREYERYRQL